MSSGSAKAQAAIKPAYLIAGSDEGKIGAALSRLRARAERESGPGALESFTPAAGGQAPDADALIAAIPSMSLMASRRYLLADGVERWTAKQAEAVIAELGALPPDLTVVLVAREQPPKVKAPKGIADAVEAAGGEVLRYQAPKARELPARLVAEASRHGFRLEPAAARLLVERLGDSTLRLANELQRLALWAAAGGGGDGRRPGGHGGRHLRGGRLGPLGRDRRPRPGYGPPVRGAPGRPGRGGHAARLPGGATAARSPRALLELEAGSSQKEVEAKLRMHPYAAKMLLRRLRGASPAELRAATGAIADLEWWTRGGSEYPDDVALTLAVRRAAGVGARCAR